MEHENRKAGSSSEPDNEANLMANKGTLVNLKKNAEI